MAWLGVVTNAGKELLGGWLAGQTLQISGAAGGSGTVREAALLAQTKLTEQKQTASIVSYKTVEGGQKIKLQFPAAEAAYQLNQIGIWGNVGGENKLLALFQNSEGVAISSRAEFPDFAYTFYGVLAIGNEGALAVTVDAEAWVTIKTLQEALEGYVKVNAEGKIPDAVLPTMDYIPKTEKNAADGVAGLDANKKIVVGQLPLDAALSDTSENPVQNKVIYAALAGKVPTTRKVNGKALSADISLTAADIGAAASQTLYSLNEINNLALKNGIYDFDIRQAGESIITVDGTVIDTGAIIHFTHNNYASYPCQLLISYAANQNTGVWKRWANNTTWSSWYRTTDYSPITTQTELDSQIRSSGIYYCHLTQTFPLPAGTKNYFMLIQGRYENGTGGHAQQIAIPFEYGIMAGLYYRIANASTWGAWRAVGSDAPNFVKTVFTGLGVTAGNWYTPETLTAAQMNDANFPYTYIGTVRENEAPTLGLPNQWWHIIYFRHYDNNGYSAQLAIPFYTALNSRARFRHAAGTVWQPWVELYDSARPPTATDVGALPTTGGTLTGRLSVPTVNFTAMSNNPTPGWIMSGNTGVGLSYYTNIDQLMRLINNRSNKVTESNTDYNIGITRAIVLSTTTPSSITNGVIVGVY